MLFLHKLLPIFLLPLGFSFVIILSGLWSKKRWLTFSGVAVLWISSTGFVGDSLLKRLENRFPKIEIEDCEMADAIVVAGGILRESRSTQGGFEWADSVDRFEQGVLLMKAGKAPLLIFPGGRVPWSNRKQSEGEELRAAAIARGIPPAAILITEEVGNTADEARAVRRTAEERGLHSFILVTTAWHMPRAEMVFQRAGVAVKPFPVDYQTRYKDPMTILDFLPQAGAAANTETAIRELLGLLYYKLLGK